MCSAFELFANKKQTMTPTVWQMLFQKTIVATKLAVNMINFTSLAYVFGIMFMVAVTK